MMKVFVNNGMASINYLAKYTTSGFSLLENKQKTTRINSLETFCLFIFLIKKKSRLLFVLHHDLRKVGIAFYHLTYYLLLVLL